MRKRSLVMFVPIFIIYILIFRFVYLENGLSVIITVCIPIFGGLLLAALLNPLLVFLQVTLKVRNRCISVFITYIIFFGSIVLIIIIITPSLLDSFTRLLKDIPKLIYIANDFFLSTSKKYEIYGGADSFYPLLQEYLLSIAQKLTSLITSFLNLAIDKVINVFVSIGNFLLSIIISVYILKDKEKIENWLFKLCYILFGKKYAREVVSVGYSLNNNVISFIAGKFLVSLMIGIFTFLGSKYIIDTPYPIIDGLIIGVTNIIPYFGAFIGGIPVIFINLLYNPYKGFLMGIFILILQQIDGLIVGPKILGSQLSIKPILIIISIIIGGGLFGPIGLFLATPIVALIKTSIDAYMRFNLKNKSIDLPHKE